MSTMRLEKVLHAVEGLNPRERLRVRAWLDRGPGNGKAGAEKACERDLRAAGLLASPPPLPEHAPRRKHKPILVRGRPLSETLLEERR